ncbi:MAG: FHA domain-containing protein [Deltaproteobacteria bacterium]|nr:FHA domain-containing protein [Deltaproteobacteria bacterium]
MHAVAYCVIARQPAPMARAGAPTGKWKAPEASTTKSAFELEEAEARLFVERPNMPAVEIELTRPEFRIGRHADAVDLVLDDGLVSKEHAKLTFDGRGYFTLEDLGSRNGIEFQGRIVRRLNLLDGDVFRIGGTTFRFEAKLQRLEPPQDAEMAEASIMADVEIPPVDADDVSVSSESES